MATTNVTLMCPVCRQPTLHTQETVSGGVQLVLILFTLGLWIIVMLLSKQNKPQCTACATRAAMTAPTQTVLDMCVICIRKTPHGIGPSGQIECLDCVERKLGVPMRQVAAQAPAAVGTHRMHCARCNRETVHDLVAGGAKCQRCAILDEDAAERGAKQ